MKKCKIRRDLIQKGLRVPIAHAYIGTDREYGYRWTGKGGNIFQIWYRGNWNTAQSIDFEF